MAMSSGKRNLSIVAFALIAGAAVGAVSLYWNQGQSGNSTTSEVAALDPAHCALSDHTKDTLRTAADGAIGAFRVADHPVPIAHIGFEGETGEPMSFGSFKDRVVLLNLWATWCAPCREEMPHLVELQEELGGDDFEVLALNVDRNGGAKPAAFLEEINATSLGLYLDPSNSAFRSLRSNGLVFGLPTTMILDHKGCVQGVLAGYAHWSSDEGKNLIDVAVREFSQGT